MNPHLRTPRRRLPASRAALAVALLPLACAAPPLPQEADLDPGRPVPLEVRSHLAMGDLVRVDIHPRPELSTGEFGRRIDYDGNLDLPLLGATAVAGLTVSEARAALQARADRFLRNATVSISVIEFAPRLFYILGEVARGGSFEIPGPIHGLQAVSLAGGTTDHADRESVVLLRVRDDRLAVHVFNLEIPGPEGLVPVEPGDLIFVRESGAGSFQKQIAPYLTGLAPPFAAAANLFLVADTLGD